MVFIMVLPMLCLLGTWQLHRATQKQHLLAEFATQSHKKPQPLVGGEPNYTQVSVHGVFDNLHTILIDNSIVNHKVGYDVVTPLMMGAGKPRLLVNRGWITRGADRQKLPQIAPILGEQTIIGMIHFPSKTFQLSQMIDTRHGAILVESIRINDLQKILNTNLYPFLLLLSPQNAASFTTHWDIVATIMPERHRAYAIQWFSLALTLVIIYIILNTRRRL